jgi:hypothetical protein
MIGLVDSPNLTLLLTDTKGRPLPADDALARAAALRHELRGADFVLSATPATGPAMGHLPLAFGGGREPAEAITLGAVALAVLPPMVSALVEYLCGWVQRNQGVRIRLAIAGEGGASSLDPSRLSAAGVAALVQRVRDDLARRGIAPADGRDVPSAA